MRSGVLLLVLIALIGGLGFWGVRVAANHVLDKVDRIADPFAAIQGDRPKVTKGLTILLAGLGDRSQVPLTGTNAEKTPQGRADSVTVDEGFTNDDLFSLALDAPKVGAHVSFVTAPIDGFKTIGGQSVVMLDQKKVSPFFAALAKDQLASYLSPSPSPQPSRSA